MKYTREDVLEGAVDVIDREGVGVSMARIAAGAGVSNGTLYHYFPTKQSLLDGTYVWLKNDLAQAVLPLDESDDIKGQMRQVWDRWFSWAKRHPARHRVTRLLREASLVTPEAAASTQDFVAALQAPFLAATEAGLVIDLSGAYLGQLIMVQLELAVDSDLSDAESAHAFEAAWRSITK